MIDLTVPVWLGCDGLRANALGHGELAESEDGQVAVPGADSTTAVGIRSVTVSLAAMQSVADAEEGENISENSQLQGGAVGAGTSDSDEEQEPVGTGGAGAAVGTGEGGARRYAAGEVAGALSQSVGRADGRVAPGLTGDAPVQVAPTRSRWKAHAQAPKAKPGPNPPEKRQ